jgi:glycosyltransferase involved in cell wall biosynthesis
VVMKVLIITQYYKPENFKINDIAEELQRKGNDVTVLTGKPNYPKGSYFNGYSLFNKSKEIINNVKVLRTIEIPRKKNIFFLVLNYISFLFSSCIKAMFMSKDFDIIYVYQVSPIYVIFPALIMRFRSKAKIFSYVCDIWPESMLNIIKNEKNIIYRINSTISRYLYRKCDILGVTSKSFIYHLSNSFDIEKNKIVYIPQHAENDLLSIKSTVENGIIDFVFMGNIGYAQDIETIIYAVDKIKSIKNFKVHFVGEGSYLETAVKLVKKLSLDKKIVFHGRKNVSELKRFYYLADVCILTLKSKSIVSETVPAKLQGYGFREACNRSNQWFCC